MEQSFFDAFEYVMTPVFFIKCSDGNILHVNSQAEDMTGYSAKKLKGKSFVELFHEDDRGRVTALVANELGIDQFFEHELQMQRKSKRRLIVDLHFKHIQDGDEKLLLITAHDITDLINEKLRAQAEKENFERLIRNMGESLIVLDMNRTIIGINPSTFNIFRCFDEALGQSIDYLIPPQELFPENSFQELLKTEALSSKRIRTKTVDGEKLVLVSSVSMMKNSKEDPSGFIIVSADITALDGGTSAGEVSL